MFFYKNYVNKKKRGGFIKVSAYCRVSTDKNDQQNSMKNQMEFFENYVKKHKDWKLYKIYCDEGISGTQTKKRTQFNQMIEDAKNHKFDLILTKEISRFSRNTIDVLYYTRLLKSYNIYVYFITDGINTAQNDGELRLSIMASIAQEESRKISERVKFGQNISMKNGTVFGNGNIYGFKLHDGKLTPQKDEMNKIREIFCAYAIEKKSICEISKMMSCEHKKWSDMSVSNILQNEKYVGDLLQKKSVTTNYITHKRIKNLHDTIYIKNNHKAIISRKLWNKTQKERQKRRESEKFSAKHYLSGKICCGKCGKVLTLKRTKKYNDTYYEYFVPRCNKECLKIRSISVEKINNQVEKALKNNFCDEFLIQKEFLIEKILKKSNLKEYLENACLEKNSRIKFEFVQKIVVFDDEILLKIKCLDDEIEVL